MFIICIWTLEDNLICIMDSRRYLEHKIVVSFSFQKQLLSRRPSSGTNSFSSTKQLFLMIWEYHEEKKAKRKDRQYDKLSQQQDIAKKQNISEGRDEEYKKQ